MSKAMKVISADTSASETLPVPQSETAAVMALIQRIVTDPTIAIERVEQAFAFHERVQASQARKSFDAAMSAAKAEIPVIDKNKLVDYTSQKGRTTYRHEDLAEIARTVDPILARHGLSYRFRTKTDASVHVTCVVSHVDGHFEENTLSAGRDESGGKNNIQAIGSAITYLQRYTLKAALGLAASRDDDGKSADKDADDLAPVCDAQAADLTKLITDTGTNIETFLKIAQAESVSDVLAKDFAGLKKLLVAKKGNGK